MIVFYKKKMVSLIGFEPMTIPGPQPGALPTELQGLFYNKYF